MRPNLLSLSDIFFFSSRRRHTRSDRDWSSDVCSFDLVPPVSSTLSNLSRIGGRIDPACSCDDDEIGRASCRERLYRRDVEGVVKRKLGKCASKRMIIFKR